MPAGDIALRSGGNAATLVRCETGVVVRLVPTCGPVGSATPLARADLQRLDEVIATAEQATGLRFATYLGDLGSDTRATAESLLGSFGADAAYTVLVAISPGQRVAEIVTGTEANLRIPVRGANTAAVALAAAATDGDLYGAFVGAIRILTDQAGPAPQD